MSRCPFCDPDPTKVFHDTDPDILCLWDAFPVNEGHALVVPRSHVAEWFSATREQQSALLKGIEVAREAILTRHSPANFNIGINVGRADRPKPARSHSSH